MKLKNCTVYAEAHLRNWFILVELIVHRHLFCSSFLYICHTDLGNVIKSSNIQNADIQISKQLQNFVWYELPIYLLYFHNLPEKWMGGNVK